MDDSSVNFLDPSLFINRELSWLSFNARVVEEAQDAALPLLERIKFLGIVSSNLDEFFMVRVAGLKQQVAAGIEDRPADGMRPAEQLESIAVQAELQVTAQYRTWNEEVLPALKEFGIEILQPDELGADQRAHAEKFFLGQVFPALTPLAVDPGHPFPHLRNQSLNVALWIRATGQQPKLKKRKHKDKDKKERKRRKKDAEEEAFAVVQVPVVLNRLVELPTDGHPTYVALEDLISSHGPHLFPGYDVVEAVAFRVTRNWDLDIDEEESDDLLLTIEEELRRRDRGAAVRLEISARASKAMVRRLRDALHLEERDVYRIAGPLQIQDVAAALDADPRPELRSRPHHPAAPPVFKDAERVIDVVGQQDVLLHHPYESFEPVVRFIEEAVDDPNVLAIKQTLYRTSGDSPFVTALSRAAQNGKQVAVLVELQARFDEWKNITWARRLEENGVHVVYGVVGFKTHCKVALVVRREGERIRRYVHLGTGNYNSQTARIYTDLSLFTARPEITEDVSALFNLLTGYSSPPTWKRLVVAPQDLQNHVVKLIRREAEKARAGEEARIVAKMNSLVDPTVIQELYLASQAGVTVELLVRGICCLRPGVEGVSENIRVSSVVDRFLEHTRIFVFGAGKDPEVYLSSADWMPRNFVRRIEVMFPVEDPELRSRVLNEILAASLQDNVKARVLQPNGTYARVSAGEPAIRSQVELARIAEGKPSPVLNGTADPKRGHLTFLSG